MTSQPRPPMAHGRRSDRPIRAGRRRGCLDERYYYTLCTLWAASVPRCRSVAVETAAVDRESRPARGREHESPSAAAVMSLTAGARRGDVGGAQCGTCECRVPCGHSAVCCAQADVAHGTEGALRQAVHSPTAARHGTTCFPAFQYLFSCE